MRLFISYVVIYSDIRKEEFDKIIQNGFSTMNIK
jgi:hypothetical protein